MTTLAEAVKKYNTDLFKRSELYKGRVIARRIPYVWSKHGMLEHQMRDLMTKHSMHTRAGKHWGGVGFLIDRDYNKPTLRCASSSFVKASSKFEEDQKFYYITVPSDFSIEFFNPSPNEKYPFPYPPNADKDDNDKYWVQKLADYKRFGVGLLWMIDIHKQTVYQYRQPDWQPITLQGKDLLNAEDIMPGLKFQVNDLFGFNLDNLFKYNKFTLREKLENIGVDLDSLI